MYPLPPYARRIEYLESTGTQWIDTGVRPADGLSFDLKAALMTSDTSATESRALFGARAQLGGSDGQCSWWTKDNFWFYGWGNNNPTGGQVQRNFAVGTPYSIHVDKSGITIDGVRQTTFTVQTAPTETSYPIYLYSINNGGELDARWASFRVYGFTIRNGTPVRSFIPCRILDTGYLWDEVEGRFYGNSGTGDFVLGPDVREGVVPTRLNPFGVGRRIDKIRRVEYLESTGTQWIDTGVAVSDPSTIAIEADEDATQPLGFTHQNVVSGTWDARYSVAGVLYICYGNYNNRALVASTETRKVARWDGASGYYENGASLANFVASVGSDSIAERNWLYGAVWDFSANAVNSRRAVAGKIYGLRVEVSNTLVRDFVPVAIGSTGYLLDRVSGKLYGNSGTGSFVLGPDIVPVEYVESDGAQHVDTGIDPGQQVEVVLDASYDSSGTKGAIVCGTRSPQTTEGRFYVLGMDASYNAKSTFGGTNYQSADSGVRRVVDFNTTEHKILWDGVVVASIANSTTVTSGAAIFVFSSNGWTTSTMYAANAKVFSLRIFDTGVIVRDFIPVRVGTEGALYDRVTDTVFRSATSTPLVAGPDASHPAG